MRKDAKAGGDEPVTALGRGAGWLGRRARNVQRRPEAFGAVTALTSVVALVALFLIPYMASLFAPGPAEPVAARPDTVALVVASRQAREHLRAREAALDSARAALARRLQASPDPVETLSPMLRARRDSLAAASANLGRLLRRASAAPLPASYRALGQVPELRGNPRVRALLDSLAEIERSREAFSATGGVDPIFVALTARASEIGNELSTIAAAQRTAVRRELEKLGAAPPPQRGAPAKVPPIDTLRLIAARDSARQVLAVARDTLADARLVLRSREERSRGAIPASPLAKSIAALVLGLAAAFAVAILRELWHPRLADAREAEWVARGSTLGRVLKHPLAPERAQRKADREVAPLIDPVTDTYRTAYAELADDALNLPLIAVIGDSAAVTATVAANLAAAAAHHARATLLVDIDSVQGSVAAALRLRPSPGLVDIVAGGADWSEAVIITTVGRDRQIDVIPAGRPGARPILPGSTAKFESLLAHFRRRYDTVVVSAPVSRLETARAVAGAVGQVVLCARTGRTRIGVFGRMASMVRAAGGEMRGIMLWEADDPDLALRAPAGGGAEPALPVSAAPSAHDLPSGGANHPTS